MKTAIVVTTLLINTFAYAFVHPISTKSPTTVTSNVAVLNEQRKSIFENEIGAQFPLGYWDPLQICADNDRNKFDRLRYIELKHGRIAMLAVVGYLVTYAGIRFPGAENIPSGFAALSVLPTTVWTQMIITIGIMEAINRDASDIYPNISGKSEFLGDFRNDFIDFGWNEQTDFWKTRKRSIELNQGRAAQMGILSLMVHDNLGNVDDILPFS